MGKRILVADDSLTIQKAFAMVLSGQDYTLLFARSADEALASAKSGRPDLVYADAVLGNGSGYDLCSSIKTDPGLRGIPVHILASNQNPYDESRALRAGADGHLLKPFDSQALIDGLSVALTAPVAEPAPVRVAPAPVVMAPTRPAPAAPKFAVERGNTTEEIDPSAESADDDSYGEFTIERSSAPTPAASWGARPPTWPGANARAATPTPPAAISPNRPSLIPGVAPPSAAASARPAPVLPGVIPAPPAGAARPTATRTIMGFPGVGGAQSPVPPTTPVAPATAVSPPAKPIVPRPSSPVPGPVMPRPTPPPPTAVLSGSTPPPQAQVRKTGSVAIPVVPQAMPAPVVAAVSSTIDQKVAAIAARGKEYEAIAKLSREIIEQVVWEVVPELAEAIIKQEIDRLVAAKR